jgi:dTDP-4-dehydrorhamnose reductase
LLILITGAGGRVGRILERRLQAKFPDRVVAATREEMDLTDPARVVLELERFDPPPTVVVNCAAVTDPYLADSSPEEVLAINREGVAGLARACREIPCRLIHFSTVDVFDGRKLAPYVETDVPDAASQYGRIRTLGELGVAEGNPDHLIVRLSLVCGDAEDGDPLRAVAVALREGVPLAWEDRRVSPIFAEDLGSATATLLKSDWRGVLHLANGGSCFLSEMAAETARHLNVLAPPELCGGPGPASFRDGGGANAVLDAGRFAVLSGRRLRDWRAALAASLDRPAED